MSDDEIEGSSAPLVEHLTELRQRLIWSVVAFLVAMIACFTVWNRIFNFLTGPICDALDERGQDCGLILIKLQEGFFVAINISFLGGLVLAFPVISYQLWRFVAPGLYKTEKNAFLPFILASPAMFMLGAAFAFYAVLPLAFDFFLSFQQGPLMVEGEAGAATAAVAAGVTFQGSVQEYLGLTIKFIVSFGLCFQLPVALSLMGKAGIVSAKGLAGVRKYAVVVILLVAAIVTPPDVVTQVIMFTVVYGLYELSIFLVRRIEKTREARLRAEGLWVDDDEDEADDTAGEAAPEAKP